jgi:hypothetical protein
VDEQYLLEDDAYLLPAELKRKNIERFQKSVQLEHGRYALSDLLG